jgi:hypothetical protein
MNYTSILWQIQEPLSALENLAWLGTCCSEGH